jgi:hypothetical protein
LPKVTSDMQISILNVDAVLIICVNGEVRQGVFCEREPVTSSILLLTSRKARSAIMFSQRSRTFTTSRCGSRISGTGGATYEKRAHTAGAQPPIVSPEGAKLRAGTHPEKFENSSANMRFPGIWE